MQLGPSYSQDDAQDGFDDARPSQSAQQLGQPASASDSDSEPELAEVLLLLRTPTPLLAFAQRYVHEITWTPTY